MDKLPFVCMGSGSLAAMSILESQWRPNLPRDAAITIVAAAVKAGIFNDLGSGSNVDITVIEKETMCATVLRNYEMPAPRPPKHLSYKFAKGTTPVLQVISEESRKKSTAMDTS